MSDTPRILGGRYEVGELIGRGGMAEVHLGHDTRLGRPVAIKILRTDLARDSSFLHRFRREAQASAGLNHANIVAVYDSGEETFTEAAGGELDIPYIVMEYVDGQTLRELLDDEKRLPADEASRIIQGVLSALEYSHSKGIVHRDIKPGNVMVTRGGSVKVMDFGIARALADSGATVTSAQAVVGTARYLSPEQAQGESVDGRSDLYSAGCVLFELLTGRAPFVGEPVSLVYQHIGEQPQPPSLYEHSVPPALDAVVLHSLEKGRDDRYQTAAEFRSDVQAARAGRPVSAAALASQEHNNADHTEIVNYPGRPGAGGAGSAGAGVGAGALAAADTGDHTAELGDDRRKRRSHAGWWAVAAIAALAAILGLGLLFNSNSSTVDKNTVPSVVGSTYDQASQTLTSSNFKVQRRDVRSQKDEGTVIAQDPAGSTKAESGSVVVLDVSTGPDSVSLPDVVGMSMENAKSRLMSSGVSESQIKISNKQRDDTGVRRGDVAAMDPKGGSDLGQGSDVTLYPSSGKVTVPDVIGKSQNDATAELYKKHLSIAVETKQVSAPSEVGNVVEQPEAGKKVENGTAVTVVIGTAAPEKTTVTKEAPVPVPAPTSEQPHPTASSPTTTAPSPTSEPSSTSAPSSSSSTEAPSSSSSPASK